MTDQTGPERTPDGRHIIVNGRKWRAADPHIPEALHAELSRSSWPPAGS